MISVWVLLRPLLTITSKTQETVPTVYSLYPRRPERLTICRYNYKGSTFSSVILRPWVLVRSGACLSVLPFISVLAFALGLPFTSAFHFVLAFHFLSVLNDAHPAIQFTMETAVNNSLPFVGMVISKTDNHLNTSVYRKKTNKGLLLHYQSHVDNRYKRSLIRTMLDRAKRLSSSPDLFSKECYDLRKMFLKLKYPLKLIDSIFKRFHASQDQNQSCIKPIDSPVLITLPFKDQKSADSVRKQLNDLGKKIDRVIQPVFTNRKISEDLKVTETKPSLVNQQCVVYEFQCNSCDSNYIGYTSRHLHLRIEEHKYSVIGKHLKDKHNQRPINLHEQFTTLKKCRGKIECLIYEMLLKRKKRPTLNTQNDSISSETVYLKIFLILFFLILLFINASLIVMYFLTYYFLYNGHYLVN